MYCFPLCCHLPDGGVYVDRLIKAYAVISKGVQEVLEKGGLEND